MREQTFAKTIFVLLPCCNWTWTFVFVKIAVENRKAESINCKKKKLEGHPNYVMVTCAITSNYVLSVVFIKYLRNFGLTAKKTPIIMMA